MKINYIDLFSGAGGLSEGFIRVGFNPIAHVEMDDKACMTLVTRLVYHKLKKEDRLEPYYDYISQNISRKDFINSYSNQEIRESVINLPIGGKNNQEIFTKIDSLRRGEEIDLIIGGPPCQAYSLVGRSRDKNRMKNDPRNYLYKDYAKFLNRFRPKVFVFENVTGFLSADGGSYFRNMRSYFKRIGYELDYSVLRGEDFGVVQKRRRIILVGWKKGTNLQYPDFKKVTQKYAITDIFCDLKKLKPGAKQNKTKYAGQPSEYLKKFEIRNGLDYVVQHVTRPHNERDLKIYKTAVKKWIKEGERLKYNDLPSDLKTHKNEKSHLDRFKVVDPNGQCHTMVAHISKDGHYYIYPSLNQIRSISIREAARIQSFPDDYYFEGGQGAAFKQIGNAVPPLMAEAIAKHLKEFF